ncbi:MAG: FAD-dependent oxidoreductase, partial [Rhodobacter sp.]|nr:FAD-dependent oxidoreductase [Rhodobacter sp.]
IVMAGEHTLFKYHATVHGAHLSGLRAAEIIDKKLA